MSLMLAALGLLVLAIAVELWWGVPARRRMAASLEQVDSSLERRQPASSAQPATVDATPAAGRNKDGIWAPWDRRLIAADLTPGLRTTLMIAIPGLAASVFAAMRIGSAWIFLVVLLMYVAGVAVWLTRRVNRLRQKLLQQLPDFLDNMVRLAALGNSLAMAFQTSTGAVGAPLRGLLDTTLRNTRSGLDLDVALTAAARPYNLQALEVLSVVMGVCVRIGGRADHILQRMSDFMRDHVQAQQELRATTSETRASTWVLGLLPPAMALLMALASPDFFQPLLHHPLGHRIILAAVLLEGIGMALLYRLGKSI